MSKNTGLQLNEYIIMFYYIHNNVAIFYTINSKISFYHHRSKRDASTPSVTLDNPSIQTTEDATSKHDNERKAYLEQSPRQGRGWCKDSHGVFCMLYNVFKGNKEKVLLNY